MEPKFLNYILFTTRSVSKTIDSGEVNKLLLRFAPFPFHPLGANGSNVSRQIQGFLRKGYTGFWVWSRQYVQYEENYFQNPPNSASTYCILHTKLDKRTSSIHE